MAMPAPLLIALAGPNGAGKSTFFESQLRVLGLPFLNADIVSRETGMDAYLAAETIASIRDQMIRRKESFVMETVFSDPVGEKVRILEGAVNEGYDVILIFIGITGPELSARRVNARVSAGGHDVPAEKLEPRYKRSLANLERAVACLPRVMIYDNSSFKNPFRMIAEYRSGSLLRKVEEPVPEWVRELPG